MTDQFCHHGIPDDQMCHSCVDEFQSNFHIKTETMTTKAPDMVNNPPHYTHGGVETIDYIQAKLTPEEFAGYCKGNALKYISRAGHKNNENDEAATEDAQKAIWYLKRLLQA
jgi:hypothetical protein